MLPITAELEPLRVPDHTAIARAPQGAPQPASGGASAGTISQLATLPNALTILGYGMGVAWAVGGPAWAGLASIGLDELDGRLARRLGQTTEIGSLLDWTGDVVLTAMTLRRMNAPLWLYPAVTTLQVALREKGWRPPVGSARALLMLYAMWQDQQRRGR